MENILLVGGQVAMLFILIAVGFLLGKLKVINADGARVIADIALFVATPCAIINSFRREATAEAWQGLLLSFGAALLCHAVGIVAGQLLFRKNTADNRVSRVSVVLSNAGFMSFPLQLALLGETGLFYGSVYVVVLNLVLWSYGQVTLDTRDKRPNIRKLLVNVGTVSLVIGVIVMALPFDLPPVVAKPLEHLGSLCTPLPMLFIGYSLSKSDLADTVKRPRYYAISAVRLLAVPLIAAVLLYLLGLRGTVLTAAIIAASAPTATAVSMLAARCDQGEETASGAVALCTLLSLVTMPPVISLVQLFA